MLCYSVEDFLAAMKIHDAAGSKAGLSQSEGHYIVATIYNGFACLYIVLLFSSSNVAQQLLFQRSGVVVVLCTCACLDFDPFLGGGEVPFLVCLVSTLLW